MLIILYLIKLIYLNDLDIGKVKRKIKVWEPQKYSHIPFFPFKRKVNKKKVRYMELHPFKSFPFSC